MSWVRVEAHAKVNLGLAVVARRGDGYHEIDTVFQTISLSDTVVLESGGRLELRVSGLGVRSDRGNLAWRAAETVMERTGCPPVGIALTKRIPVAAGLGGGSADAAAVLAGANELYRLGLGLEDLEQLGAEIGSDVPFLIRGGTARGRGRGERLERVRRLQGVWFVLVTPRSEVSARKAYGKARIGLTATRRLIRLTCSAIQNSDWHALGRALRNDLEAGVVSFCPEVGAARDALRRAGALGVVMSGSGPTVVGLTESEEAAREIASHLSGHDWTIHVVEPIDAGCAITGHGDEAED